MEENLILIGDPGQLPPVADKPLYHAKPSSAVGEQGYQTYKMFDKVVKLTVNQRVQGMTSEQVTSEICCYDSVKMNQQSMTGNCY